MSRSVGVSVSKELVAVSTRDEMPSISLEKHLGYIFGRLKPQRTVLHFLSNEIMLEATVCINLLVATSDLRQNTKSFNRSVFPGVEEGSVMLDCRRSR